MMKVKKDWLLVLLALVLIVGVGLLMKPLVERMGVLARFPDRGVPRINITLSGVTLEEINSGSKETKYEGNGFSLYEGDDVQEFDGVQVKGRGNTTWLQPKKPYQIKFAQKIDLLGMGKTKEWVLFANYLDASQMRNDIALYLAEMLGMEYNRRGEFVELYVDGEYEGLYYLLKKVEIGKGSVELRESNALLFELDMLHKKDENYYKTYFGEHLVLKDSLLSMDDRSGVVDEFIVDFDDAERAIEEMNYEKLAQLWDTETFAEYYLVNEFAVNPDAYSTSFYLYRNNEGKIAAGPVWDFDLAFANRVWTWRDDEEFFSPRGSMARKNEAFGYDGRGEDLNIPRIFYYLMDMEEFREKVDEIYQVQMMGKKDELMQAISDKVNKISKAVRMDSDRWGRNDFETEIKMVTEWVGVRYDFFEEEYGKNAVGTFGIER